MRFEWDENKNQANIRKHGVDFSDAADIFNTPCWRFLTVVKMMAKIAGLPWDESGA